MKWRPALDLSKQRAGQRLWASQQKKSNENTVKALYSFFDILFLHAGCWDRTSMHRTPQNRNAEPLKGAWGRKYQVRSWVFRSWTLCHPLSIYFVWVLQSENSLDIMPSWKKVASITHPCYSLQMTSCLVTRLKSRDSCMVVVWLGLGSVRSWLYFLALSLSLSLLKSYAWQSVDRETCTF